jgi:hypothetical protein
MLQISSASLADKHNIESALAYAAMGWQVFPAPPDSKKSYKSEQRSGAKWGMTGDPVEIRADFTRWPKARIGIPTGAVNGIVVVEYDTIEGHGIDGLSVLRELEAQHGPLPPTRQVISPSGSVHNYYLHPGVKVLSKPIVPGVDCKADGGMVIGAPSVNPDGRAYRLINDVPIVALPDAWIELLKFKKPTIRERATAAVNAHRLARTIQYGGGNAYANAALSNEIKSLSGVGIGARNMALNKSAFSLFQLVHAGLLKADEVERRLIDACVANGLIGDGLSSISATIRSAFNAAAAKPRRGLA